MTVLLAHSRRFAAACLLLCACAARAHDGDLDPTFGVAGVTHTGWYNPLLNAIALRPDGRIVACGQYDAPAGSSSLHVRRQTDRAARALSRPPEAVDLDPDSAR